VRSGPYRIVDSTRHDLARLLRLGALRRNRLRNGKTVYDVSNNREEEGEDHASAYGCLIGLVGNLLILSAPEAQSIPTGTWEGQGFQKNRSGPVMSWSIRLRILQNGNGTIEYPSLNCGGTLTRLPTAVIAQYREHIDHGSMCADNGTVEIQVDRDKLLYHWASEGANPQMTAVGELSRATP
jgi:hypothetical protein